MMVVVVVVVVVMLLLLLMMVVVLFLLLLLLQGIDVSLTAFAAVAAAASLPSLSSFRLLSARFLSLHKAASSSCLPPSSSLELFS